MPRFIPREDGGVVHKLVLGEDDTRRAARMLFKRVSGLLAAVVLQTAAFKGTNLDRRGLGLGYLLTGIAGTSGGISKLTEHAAWVPEAYMLGRANLEQCVNAAYLVACTDDEYAAYVEHAIARRVRHEDRSITINGTTVSIRRERPDGPLPEHVEAAVRRFTNSRRKPKKWTDLSIEARAGVVARSYPNEEKVLALSILGIYAEASDAIHGTLFGLTAFDAPKVDPESPDGFRWEKRSESAVALLVTLSRVAQSLLRILASALDRADVRAQAEAATAEIDGFFVSLRESE